MFWHKNNDKEIKQAVTQLFPRLWRYCLILTASKDRADDLAQSVCLRALQKASQYQAGTTVDRWLFRIAKNMWFNELRAEAVRHGGGLQTIDEYELEDTLSDPAAATINRDVISGVLTLPEAQRVVVGLVYIEGYSYKEASDILSIPIGTVMSRLATARSHLSSRFKHYQYDAIKN